MTGAQFTRTAATLVGLLLTLPVLAQTQERYTISLQNEVSGQMVVERKAAGRVEVDYSYRDNGRGPDIVEAFDLAADGMLKRYAGKGKSTYGGEIRETFERSGTRVKWTSLVDSGEREAAPDAPFVPIEGSTEVYAQIARSLLARAGAPIDGLPSGRFAIEKLATLAVPSTAEPGGSFEVALYAMTGFDLAPTMIWLRDDERHALFAEVAAGWAVMAAGYEPVAPRLLALQNEAQTTRLRGLQQRLAHPLPGLTRIANVRWFDARSATLRGPSDIYLHGGRIASIEPAGQRPRQVTQSVDGSGRTLLPGLFDMHGHMSADDGLLQLAAGVTTVRDVGNDNVDLDRLRAEIDAGLQAGPRISANGFIEGRSPFSSRNGIVVASVDEAKRAVDWYADRGVLQLKLYNSFKPEWVPATTAYAHAKGLRVGGHVPAFMRAEDAVRGGYDEIHHINQVMLNFLTGPADDTRSLLRFNMVGDRAHTVELASPKVTAVVDLFKRKGTVVDPTIACFEASFTQRNGSANPSFGMVADHLPATLRRGLLFNSTEINDENAARYKASFARMLELVGRLYRAGVPLVAGTDDFAGFTLHRELELYVEAGIPAAQALRIATLNGARFTQTLAQTGTIERGKLADLVLIDGDPTQRISDIRKPSLVIKGGTAYLPAEIYEAVGIRPFVPAVRIIRE